MSHLATSVFEFQPMSWERQAMGVVKSVVNASSWNALEILKVLWCTLIEFLEWAFAQIWSVWCEGCRGWRGVPFKFSMLHILYFGQLCVYFFCAIVYRVVDHVRCGRIMIPVPVPSRRLGFMSGNYRPVLLADARAQLPLFCNLFSTSFTDFIRISGKFATRANSATRRELWLLL